MTLESVLEGLTKAVQANTAAILKAVGATPAPEPAKPGRPAKKDKSVEKKSGPTLDDVVAQTQLAVTEHQIIAEVREVLNTMGAKKATELKESQYPEYMDKVGKLIADRIATDKAADESLV